MVIKVGINGFGRIGRIVFRTCLENPLLEVTAINDPAIDIEYIVYLIKFDSTHGRIKGKITRSNDEIKIENIESCKYIKVHHQKLPEDISWTKVEVQYVVEASGMFTSLEKASGHLKSDGVKRVVVTAPSADVPMIILGVNDNTLTPDVKVISCASSTLYCLAPIVKILEDNYGVSEGFVSSIHAMTPSLKPLDGLCIRGRHWRDHRSITQNIIPAATGACKALGKIIPQVKDKMSGLAFRVPIVNVSVLDLTVRLKTNTTLEDILNQVDKYSKTSMKNIINISREEAVSSDFIGDSNSCTLDANSSLQLTPDFFKIISWYENEYSYACRVVDSIIFSEKQFVEQAMQNSLGDTTARRIRKNDIFSVDQLKHDVSLSAIKITDINKTSTSDESGIKIKLASRPLQQKKQISNRNTGNNTANNYYRDYFYKNGACKQCKDNKIKFLKTSNIRNTREALFQSCTSLGVSINGRSTENFKTQPYLDVKDKMFKLNSKCKNKVNSELQCNKCSDISKLRLKEDESKSGEKDASHCQSKVSQMLPPKDCYLNNSYISFNIPSTVVTAENVENNDLKTHLEDNLSEFKTNLEMKKSIKEAIHIMEEPLLRSTISSESIKKSDNNYKNESSIINDELPNTLASEFSLLSNKNVFLNKTNNSQLINNDITTSEYSSNFEESDSCILLTADRDYCGNEKITTNKKQRLGIDNCSETKYQKIDVAEQLETGKNNKQMKNMQHYRNKVFSSEPNDNMKKSIIFFEKPYELIESKHVLKSSKTLTRQFSDNIRSPKLAHKQDIYDKLDSASASDSDNSFQIHKRKSQVINFTDLTNSLEDLGRLDNICKIIEISDELSDELFSELEKESCVNDTKKWSFKDLCEKIKLDEFSNKVFGKPFI